MYHGESLPVLWLESSLLYLHSQAFTHHTRCSAKFYPSPLKLHSSAYWTLSPCMFLPGEHINGVMIWGILQCSSRFNLSVAKRLLQGHQQPQRMPKVASKPSVCRVNIWAGALLLAFYSLPPHTRQSMSS